MFHTYQKCVDTKEIINTDRQAEMPVIVAYNNLNRSRTKYKFKVMLLLSILLFSWAGTVLLNNRPANAGKIQKGIAGEIIRFHVIANSNSNTDQALKYKVKDALVKELSPYLKNAADINEGRSILNARLPMIKSTAEAVIKQNGFLYPVTVTLEDCYFPMKVYGDYTFPPGIYEALRVKIGKALGENWWCVMFPPLCFVDETYSIVDKETEEQLKYLLTEEEYESLRCKKVPVKVKFKLWETVKELFK